MEYFCVHGFYGLQEKMILITCGDILGILPHSEQQIATILIHRDWVRNRGEPKWVFLNERSTVKYDCTNKDRLITEAGYVLLQNENPSDCDKHMIGMTYLTITSHEEVKGPVLVVNILEEYI